MDGMDTYATQYAAAVARYAKADDPQTAVLRDIEGRAGGGFAAWMADLYAGEPHLLAENTADEASRLDHLHDWLHDEHSIRVRPDGLVTFWKADDATRHLIGDLPVLVYHHTSDRLTKKILRDGLVATPRKRSNPYANSGSGVYVTTETSGPAPDGYGRNAASAHGGNPTVWGVKTTLHHLEPDPDDEDIRSGDHQFVLPHVPPHDLIHPKDV